MVDRVCVGGSGEEDGNEGFLMRGIWRAGMEVIGGEMRLERINCSWERGIFWSIKCVIVDR